MDADRPNLWRGGVAFAAFQILAYGADALAAYAAARARPGGEIWLRGGGYREFLTHLGLQAAVFQAFFLVGWSRRRVLYPRGRAGFSVFLRYLWYRREVTWLEWFVKLPHFGSFFCFFAIAIPVACACMRLGSAAVHAAPPPGPGPDALYVGYAVLALAGTVAAILILYRDYRRHEITQEADG
jgi:hypothetical protein